MLFLKCSKKVIEQNETSQPCGLRGFLFAFVFYIFADFAVIIQLQGYENIVIRSQDRQ